MPDGKRDIIVELILLFFAAFSPRFALLIADQPPVQDQVDIFRKAVDQIKALGYLEFLEAAL